MASISLPAVASRLQYKSRAQRKAGVCGRSPGLPIAPTEVRCEFLKSSFFVVAVFLWSNRVITWSLGGGVKDEKTYFSFPNILLKKYFYLSSMLNSNKKNFVVNIDLN